MTDLVEALLETLVCAVISGKAGSVAEPDEVLDDLTRVLRQTVAGLPRTGLADYDGVDLRLTPSGLSKARAAFASSRLTRAEAEPEPGGVA